jgi:CDP-diacylglycerol--glycerol-3-phosphate 3-phosphatidyltransferase
MQYLKKSIPNILSLLRILLSFALPLTIHLRGLFVGLVLLIGVTDIADGYIARKYKWVTKLGAKLDSLGDLVFFAIILLIVFFRYEQIITDNYSWFLITLALKLTTAALSRIKYGEFVFIHTIANKLTGFLVFVAIVIIPFDTIAYFITGVFLMAILSAAEELGITILNKTPDVDQKSIFKKRNNVAEH